MVAVTRVVLTQNVATAVGARVRLVSVPTVAAFVVPLPVQHLVVRGRLRVGADARHSQPFVHPPSVAASVLVVVAPVVTVGPGTTPPTVASVAVVAPVVFLMGVGHLHVEGPLRVLGGFPRGRIAPTSPQPTPRPPTPTSVPRPPPEASPSDRVPSDAPLSLLRGRTAAPPDLTPTTPYRNPRGAGEEPK